ncbi:hypothetical protein [Profundibacter sp.]
MRIFAGCFAVVTAVGVGSIMPTAANAAPGYKMTKRCADLSGFTARAMKHPDYTHRKVYATPQELAYINRCVTSPTTGKAPVLRGALPYPGQYPLMSGDSALWPRLTMAQQRRAMLFLQSGSTIQSSLMGD